MNRQYLLAFTYFILVSLGLRAQSDNYIGTWQMQYQPAGTKSAVRAQLQVANAVDRLLYPAKLTLQCDSFNAVYELLLFKKDSRELAISRNKFARKEHPFSLGLGTLLLNGSFDYSRTLSGTPVLTLNRLPIKQSIVRLPDTLNAMNKATAARLQQFLAAASISLEKLNSNAWQDAYSERITDPKRSPAYFGLSDTIHVKNRDGYLYLSGNKKEDAVSVMLNAKACVDRIDLTKKERKEDILLDTGMNILALYAEAFGNQEPHAGRVKFEFGQSKFGLDFNNRGDSAASFIVARVYCDKDKERDIYFSDYNPFAAGEKPLGKNEKFLGSLVSTSRQLTLAIWDDAVEDGDSVSININGDWIAKGFPVKKNTQFITVTLKPGANTINFMADNLGSIAPNTAILEIIDGRKRKSFSLETVLGESNLLKIRYDVQAP